MEATNRPEDKSLDTTKLPNPLETFGKDKDLDLSSLTDQNWLFIKHYLETADIKKAFELAGYLGKNVSDPYHIFKRLKPFIEEIGNMAVTSRLKLVADLSKALSLPLSPDKQTVTVSEWLRLRKFAATLTPDTQQAPKMSVLVVNRYGNGQGNIGMDNKPALDLSNSNIIDIDPLP
jgi:hypothetical protein